MICMLFHSTREAVSLETREGGLKFLHMLWPVFSLTYRTSDTRLRDHHVLLI